MTKQEKWQLRYLEMIGFVEINHMNPSRYTMEKYHRKHPILL